MKVGDVVVATSAVRPLRSGSEWYSHAICIQVEPIVLVSEGADMRWESTLENMPLQALCQAHPDIVAACMKRL